MSDEINAEDTQTARTEDATQGEPTQSDAHPNSEDHASTEDTATSPDKNQHEGTSEEEKRKINKMSILEKKKNELERRNEELERLTMNVENTFKGNKKAYDAFRDAWKRDSGKDLGEYETRFDVPKETLQQETGVSQNNQQSQQSSASNPPDIKKVIQEEWQKRESQQQWKDAFTTLVTEVPDLEPAKVHERGEETKASATWKKISTIATAFAYDENNSQVMGLDEAVKKAARMVIPEYNEKVEADLKKDGELKGKADAYATGVASGGGASASSTAKGKGTMLDELGREALALGGKIQLTEDDIRNVQ